MGFDYNVENEWFKPKKTVLDKLEEYLNKNIEMTKIAVAFHKDMNDTYEVEKYSRDIDLFSMVLDKIQELKKENENG